jgi:hypothetical protein
LGDGMRLYQLSYGPPVEQRVKTNHHLSFILFLIDGTLDFKCLPIIAGVDSKIDVIDIVNFASLLFLLLNFNITKNSGLQNNVGCIFFLHVRTRGGRRGFELVTSALLGVVPAD